MINNDTNNNNNNTFNNHNNTSNNDVRIPTTTTTTTTPSSTKRRRTRLPSTFSFRKLLIYIRVLILALALVSLILDAITISFQTNVMNLGYEDVSRQAFLILTPDLLAIGMIVFLFVYPSSLCCGSGTGGSERGVVVEEEYYDYDNEEQEEEEEGSQTRNGAGGGGGGGASSVTATAPTAAVAATGEGVGGAGNTRMATARSQAQQQQQQQQGIPSLSPATYSNYINDEEEDSLQRRRPYHNQHQNTGLPLHSHQQPLPLHSTSHSHHTTTNLASGTTPTTTTNNGRQQLLHSQDHDRITTTTFDTAATTLSSPSIAFPHTAKSTGAGTRAGETEKHFQEQQPSTLPPGGASLAEMIAQEEMDETSRKQKRARLYTIARVVFSLGLTILALYWPAGQFKPNLAGSVGTPAAPVVEGDHQQPQVHGNGSMSFDHLPRTYPPPMPSTKEALPALISVTITTLTPMPTPTTSAIFGSTPGVSSTNSNNVASTSNGTTIFAPSSISNFNTKDYYIGGRHNRKGRQKEQHGCTDEESYGDDDSATVYCRSRLIRPIVTYIWSVFLVVELCIAALAGDFSKHGIRRRKYRDFGDDGDVHVDGGGMERGWEKEEHVQSVQSLAVSESLGAGTGAIAHQHQHQHPPQQQQQQQHRQR
ncbi:MAG: hypothetical protein J3R72DRAFT_428878 [Linnemannia gamsii]|nr:MAG: hypothetical protein J3R72DRAFT_428878 [Linnemannia gamsii]